MHNYLPEVKKLIWLIKRIENAGHSYHSITFYFNTIKPLVGTAGRIFRDNETLALAITNAFDVDGELPDNLKQLSISVFTKLINTFWKSSGCHGLHEVAHLICSVKTADEGIALLEFEMD